jgi:uncharacterized protein YbbK (DUF523 family)
MTVVNMRKILVSECLYGGRAVRYDGGELPLNDRRFLKWKEEGRLAPVCPEVFGGLPVPRSDAQRVGDRILTRDGKDVTGEYAAGAAEALRLAREHDVAFAVMKQRSPSCGGEFIYDGTFTGAKIPGQGLAVEYLRNAGFTVFSEDDLDEAERLLRELED